MSRPRSQSSSYVLWLTPLVMVVAALLLLFSARATAEREALVRRTYEVLDQLHETQRAYDRVSRMTRKCIHTKDENHREEALRRAEEVPPLVAELLELVSDNVDQSRSARELKSLIETDLNTCRRAAEVAGTEGPTAAMDLMGALRYGESPSVTLMQNMRGEEKILLADRSKSASRHGILLFVLSVLFMLLAVGSLLGAVLALARNNTRLALAHEEARRAEAALRKSEGQIREKASQLETLNGELELFSYTVSHDLRAPPRHVNGFIDLLRKHLEPTQQTDAKVKHYLETIAEAAHRMGQLIDDLLSFARTSRGELRQSTVAMDRLVSRTVATAKDRQGGPSAQIEVAPLPVVQGDENMLNIVWENLVDNALKYSGGRERPPQVRIESRREGNEVVFSVADNGIGFDMRFADKLFAVFGRLHADPNYPGTGIGLATVRRIVTRHGGRVWAEGRPGEGATFYFSLPTGTEGVS